MVVCVKHQMYLAWQKSQVSRTKRNQCPFYLFIAVCDQSVIVGLLLVAFITQWPEFPSNQLWWVFTALLWIFAVPGVINPLCCIWQTCSVRPFFAGWFDFVVPWGISYSKFMAIGKASRIRIMFLGKLAFDSLSKAIIFFSIFVLSSLYDVIAWKTFMNQGYWVLLLPGICITWGHMINYSG